MGKRTMKLATRGKRFGAAAIDIAIPFVCYIIFMIAAAAAAARTGPGRTFGYGFEEEFGYGYGYSYGYQSNTPGWLMGLLGFLGLLLLAYVIVECVFFAKSKTIGKAILGMQVVSSTDGRPIGFWMMLFREVIVKQASSVFLLGYIWILIDDRNRGWHDKILDTYVVDLKESEKLNVVIAPAPAERPAAPAPEEIVSEIELTPVPAEALAETAETVTAVPASAEAAPVEAVEAVGPSVEEAAAVEAVEAVPEAEAPVEAVAEAAAPAAQMPKKPVIRLDVDEDE